MSGKPRFSVVSCVRGRVEMCRRMIESMYRTAKTDPELILRCDEDDDGIINLLKSYGLTFIVGPRKKGYGSIPAFMNEAARLSTADVVFLTSDDVVFNQEGWDEALLSYAEQYPDGIYNLGVETMNAGNFVFPCTSRKIINIFGGLYDERLVYPDIWLRDVMAAFGRAIRVPVQVTHDWHGISPDQAAAVAAAQAAQPHYFYAQCVEEGIAKVKAALQ